MAPRVYSLPGRKKGLTRKGVSGGGGCNEEEESRWSWWWRVRKYTPEQSQAVSSLRVARIMNIWQSPLLVAALMPPSTDYMCALVCRQRGTKYFLVGRRSNTVVVEEPRNLVELRIALLAAATRRRHLMTSEPLRKFVHGHELHGGTRALYRGAKKNTADDFSVSRSEVRNALRIFKCMSSNFLNYLLLN